MKKFSEIIKRGAEASKNINYSNKNFKDKKLQFPKNNKSIMKNNMFKVSNLDIKTRKMSTFHFKKSSPSKIKHYDSQIFFFFSKLVNLNTKNGLKKRSLKFFLDCFFEVKKHLKPNITNKDILTRVFFSLNPYFILKKYNLRRRSIIIPFPITKDKRIKITTQIFLAAVKKRAEPTFREKLIEELKDFYRNKTPMSVKLRNEKMKIAIDNKTNIRFLRFFR